MRQPKCSCGVCKYCIKRAEYLRHRESYIARSQKYQKENKEQTNRKNSKWKKDNMDKVLLSQAKRRVRLKSESRSSAIDRRHDLMRHYKITPEWWDAKFKEQGGCCGICGCPANNAVNRRMHVDHSHATDRNRGILCHHCNTALERLESVEDWTVKALAYLKHYEDLYWEQMNDRYGDRKT